MQAHVLPEANAATTIQAHQKDQYVKHILTTRLKNLLTVIGGYKFVNSNSNCIETFASLIYLSLTTLRSVRTLGEEYSGLFIVNEKNDGVVKWHRRLLYIVAHVLVPSAFAKVCSSWLHHPSTNGNGDEQTRLVTSIRKVFDFCKDIHLIIFYFTGGYYDIAKRVFGLRYASDTKLTGSESESESAFRNRLDRSYRVLGMVLAVQTSYKYLPSIRDKLKEIYMQTVRKWSGKPNSTTDENKVDKGLYSINQCPDPGDPRIKHIDLSDSSVLPFIPENSRKCTLCLTYITDPSCAPCGHLYCWNCLLSWCNEKPVCPLCRYACKPQQILPIR